MKVIDFANKPLEGVFALVYGASGTGKTHLIGTLAELGTVLVVDVDKGFRTLQTAKDIKNKENIEVVSFDQFADLDSLYKLVQKNEPAEWSKALNITVAKPFDWIVYDTWSETQWYMMQQLRKNSGLGGGAFERLDFRKNIQIQHWGMMTDLNKLAIESLRDCTHVNQVFTMQETAVKDDITGAMVKGPAIHGKLVQELPAYFEIVVHTYTDISGSWCATTLPKQGWPAKTRLGVGKDVKLPRATDFFGK